MDSSLGKLLDGVVEAVGVVFPFSVECLPSIAVNESIFQSELGVLIGLTGSVKGRLVVEAPKRIFSHISSAMYGMELDGDMLESFVGELGNMVGGSICTRVSTEGLSLDITPPTVLVGQTKMTGLGEGRCLPVAFPDGGQLHVSVVLDKI
jgi:chemotaxis protein CheX